MIKLIFSFYQRIEKDDSQCNCEKLQKNDLRDQAFHPEQVADRLFVLKPGEQIYSPLDSEYYSQIMQRSVSF